MPDQDNDEDYRELVRIREALHFRHAREDLTYYAETIEIPMVPINKDRNEDDTYPVQVKLAKHHRLMLTAAQDLLTGKLPVDGVMAFFSPGSAKSTFLSVVAASWALGHFPRPYELIGTSYGDDHAYKFSRRIRQIAETGTYKTIFNTSTDAENRSIGAWGMQNGNTYRAAGISGGITGNRANAIFIDDPVKDREQADSELIRQKVWDSFVDVLDTRLKPNGKLFLIMTRWHEDDLAGRILGEGWKGQSGVWPGTDGRKWLVLNCPLLAEHADDPLGRKKDELMWPEYFKLEDAKRRQKLGGRTWASLYQQRPAPNEGAILARSYWRPWKRTEGSSGKLVPPECEFIFLAYDTAIEASQEADESAMTAWGIFVAPADDKRMGDRVLKSGQIAYHAILLGAWHERVSAIDLKRTILGYKDDNGKRVRGHMDIWPETNMILIEKKSSGMQLIQELQRLRLPVRAVEPKGMRNNNNVGKVPRAHAISMLLENGGVWYVPGAATNAVLDQCAAFPYGRQDDLVDTVLYALAHFRDNFYFNIPSDFPDEVERNMLDLQETEDERASRKRTRYGVMSMDHRAVRNNPRRALESKSYYGRWRQ